MQHQNKETAPQNRLTWVRDPLGGQTQVFHKDLQGTPLFENPNECDPSLSLQEGKLSESISGVQVRPEDRTYGGRDA